MLRLDRRRRGRDPSLPARMFILGSGAVLAYAGMASDRPALVTIAIAELAIGLFLSLRARRQAFQAQDSDDYGDTSSDLEADADTSADHAGSADHNTSADERVGGHDNH